MLFLLEVLANLNIKGSFTSSSVKPAARGLTAFLRVEKSSEKVL
jgi:hypothetical protein